jgi:hypothetical protein
MVRKPIRIRFSAFLISCSFVFQSLAKLELGSMALVVMDAQLLQSTGYLSRGAIYRQKLLAGVGGVAFEQEALPAESLNVHSLALEYNNGREDGSRRTGFAL